MIPENSDPSEASDIPLLSRSEQIVIAVAAFFALLSMAVYYLVTGGWNGGWIAIERAAPLHAEFKVDINAADWPEMSQLPEIGEVLARRIVDSRNKEGSFREVDDLQRISGIGPRTMELIRPYLLPIDEPNPRLE